MILMTKANKLDKDQMMKCPICLYPLVIGENDFFCKNHGNKQNILKLCFNEILIADKLEDINREVIEFINLQFANRITKVGDMIKEGIGNTLEMLKKFAENLQRLDSKKRNDSVLF